MKNTTLKAANLFNDGSLELFDAISGKWIGSLKKGEGVTQTLFDLPEPIKKPEPVKLPEVKDKNQLTFF